MLSTQYRLRLQAICKDIAAGTEVTLEDMIWAEKLSKVNTSARGMLSQARRLATDEDGSCLKYLDIGDSNPKNYKKGFNGADDIADWFKNGLRTIDQTIGDNVDQIQIVRLNILTLLLYLLLTHTTPVTSIKGRMAHTIGIIVVRIKTMCMWMLINYIRSSRKRSSFKYRVYNEGNIAILKIL